MKLRLWVVRDNIHVERDHLALFKREILGKKEVRGVDDFQLNKFELLGFERIFMYDIYIGFLGNPKKKKKTSAVENFSGCVRTVRLYV